MYYLHLNRPIKNRWGFFFFRKDQMTLSPLMNVMRESHGTLRPYQHSQAFDELDQHKALIMLYYWAIQMYNDLKGHLLDPLHHRGSPKNSLNHYDSSGLELTITNNRERRCRNCRKIGYNARFCPWRIPFKKKKKLRYIEIYSSK